MEKIAAAKKEYEENARPVLTAKVENMDEYENVILAFPNMEQGFDCVLCV